jgi:putative transcriptional regulator
MKKRILLFSFILLQILLFHHSFALAKASENYLKGKFYSSIKNNFLIATEKMNDNRFEKTVIAMLENDEEGAWGLVINKPIGSIPLAMLIDPSLSTSEEREKLYGVNILIFWGGPVEVKKIFVLHSSEYQSESTEKYDSISISQDYNILFDIAENKGPEKSLVILGYSGWGSGQLEGEMERDDWILSDLDLDIIFEKDSKKKWKEALKRSFIKI